MSEENENGPKWWRLILLLAFLLVLYVIAQQTNMSERLTKEYIREMMTHAGVWGVFAFWALFAMGVLVYIPGVVFVAAAVLAYGSFWGGLIGYVGALLSLSSSFFVVRIVGGKFLSHVKRPFLRKWLDRLEQYPIRVVIVLRTVLWMAPVLNYAFAMSNLRFRDYFVGSALGLIFPVVFLSAFLEVILNLF